MREWVVVHFGWMFTAIMVSTLVFLLVVGLGLTGKIRLGQDDSEPEFSTFAWISMLFTAGLGIGLIFYGPMEPLTHFLNPPPFAGVEGGSHDAVFPGLTAAILHQAIMPWVVYALVGGSLAYAAFRRGRLPLISSLFEPLITDPNNRVAGKIIDIFAMLVTLFGTATSLGIGALQIRTGTSIITGKPLEDDGVMVAIISILTVIFIFSATSGVKRGIRILSNTNMGLVITLGLFVLITGPTLFIFDLLPPTVLQLIQNFINMMSANPSQGPEEKEFVTAYTMLFWAWWISWSPVRGHDHREDLQGTDTAPVRQRGTARADGSVPGVVCGLRWHHHLAQPQRRSDRDQGLGRERHVRSHRQAAVLWSGEHHRADRDHHLLQHGRGLRDERDGFDVPERSPGPLPARDDHLGYRPGFGRPVPASRRWRRCALRSAGHHGFLALPFAVILIGVMVAWAKDLHNDPVMLRRRFAVEAIDRGVRRGLDEHDGHFIFGATQVPAGQGAAEAVDVEDESFHKWYTDNASEDFMVHRAEEKASEQIEREAFEKAVADAEARAEAEAEIANDARAMEDYWTEYVSDSDVESDSEDASPDDAESDDAPEEKDDSSR